MSRMELAYKYTKKFKPTLFDSGIGARLPDAYRKFYDEWKNTPPEPVHYIPYTGKTWVRNESTGEVQRFDDVPLPLKFPKELNCVFTGGERVIQGYKNQNEHGPVPHFWVPIIYRSAIYSEILDKYLSALMTKRAVELIHRHEGLDSYLLKTKACDLYTLVALKLKKKLLTALNDKDLPYDAEKNKLIFQKYEKYLIPPEEIEWYGLSFVEACNKQKNIEEEQEKASVIPLKHAFRAELIRELQEKENAAKIEAEEQEKIKKSTQWFKKIPGIDRLSKGS